MGECLAFGAEVLGAQQGGWAELPQVKALPQGGVSTRHSPGQERGEEGQNQGS